MFVFHVEHVETYGGPVETRNLGLYARWADAVAAAQAAMVPYVDELGEHYSQPTFTVDENGLATSASWDDGHDGSVYITRREVM